MTKAAAADARASLRGIVETVFYSGATFSAGRLRTVEGALVNFAGKVFVKPNDPVRLEGHWTHHPKYGRQFAVEALGYDLEMDPDGLANFLANHPDVKGIGPAKARLIADHFGPGFDAAIRTLPEAVAAVAKAPLESMLALQKIWIANSDFNAAMTYLSRFGLTHHQVTTLVERFGSQVVPILERDPRPDPVVCHEHGPADQGHARYGPTARYRPDGWVIVPVAGVLERHGAPRPGRAAHARHHRWRRSLRRRARHDGSEPPDRLEDGRERDRPEWTRCGAGRDQRDEEQRRPTRDDRAAVESGDVGGLSASGSIQDLYG